MKKFFTLQRKTQHSLFVFFIIAFLASCSKKNDPTPDNQPPKETSKSSASTFSNQKIQISLAMDTSSKQPIKFTLPFH